MSQATKGGPWRDDLMQEAKQGQAWRIEKQVGPIEDYLPFFPDQESGKAYEQLLFNLPVNLHCMDGAGRITSVNRQWLESLGYQLNDVSGRHWHEFLSSASRHHLTQNVYPRYLQTNLIRNAEITMFKSRGQQAHMLMSAHGYRGSKGRIERSIVILQEVTARKSAETALQRSEQRFRGAFEAAAHGIVLVAPNGRIIAWNPAFKDLSGRSDEELVSIAFDESIHADDKAPFLAAMRRLIDGEVPSLKMELRYVGGERPQAWALTSVSLVRSEAGEIDHLVVQIVDTTSRRQAERQLQQAQKMEAVGQLTGGLAHDFNNLLTVILGNLNLIEHAVDGDGKARQRLLEAAEAAKKGSELTRQLLSFSSQQEMEPKEVRVNDLIRHMLSLIARTIGEAVELQLMLSPEDALVEVDPTQLETSLINLAINGRDAMGGGGKLTIETRIVDLDHDYVASNPDVRTGRHVLIAVTDSGSGIPKSLLDKVFQPFFTTKPAGKGSGLGLSMVYGFAARSDGHVRIYSEEGHGTSVKIYLPVKSVDLADTVTQNCEPPAVIDASIRFEPEIFQAEAPPQAEEPAVQAEDPEPSPALEENMNQTPEPKAAAEHSAPLHRPAGWKTIPPLAPPSPKPVPLRRESQPAPAEPPAAGPPIAERRVKILVVEDQEGVRTVATGFLTDFGYDVIEAADGIAALDILTTHDDIDLMFTDVVMPGGLNGFDLAQAAQQIRPDLRIVHTSGYPKGAMVHMEEPRLKDNIIMKPYRREELKRVIEETLQKSAS